MIDPRTHLNQVSILTTIFYLDQRKSAYSAGRKKLNMKTAFLSALLLLSAVLISPAQSRETGEQVLDLSKRKFQWMIDRRVDSLSVILDDRLMYIHSNGLNQTRNDVLGDLKSGRLTYQSAVVRDTEVRVYEGVAIVTGKGKFSGIINATPFSVDLFFTEVYVLKNNLWLLASRHANKLL